MQDDQSKPVSLQNLKHEVSRPQTSSSEMFLFDRQYVEIKVMNTCPPTYSRL